MNDGHAIIGRCEVLFCINAAEFVEYRDGYDRELAVCGECSEGEHEKDSKRSQLADFANEVLPDGGQSDERAYLSNCNQPGCTRERYTSNGYFCEKHRVSRPPCDAAAGMGDVANHDGLERRVCPNCRLFFDTGEESNDVFCGDACHRRHKRGEYL